MPPTPHLASSSAAGRLPNICAWPRPTASIALLLERYGENVKAYRVAVSTFEDAARIAASLPGVTERERHGNTTWFVGGKAFAWDRPFSKADIRRFGEVQPPSGPILAVAVADLDEKEAVLASSSEAVFTIPHFNGYAAVLIQLDSVPTSELEGLVTDAWLVHASPEDRDRYGVQ